MQCRRSVSLKWRIKLLCQHWGWHPGCPFKGGRPGNENGVGASLIGRLIAEGSSLRGQRGHPFLFFFFFPSLLDWPKNIFACPLDSFAMGIMLQVILGMLQFLLLTRIPTSHAKVCTHLTPGGLSGEVSPPHVGGLDAFFADYGDGHVFVSFLNDFVLAENMWHWRTYPLGQWHLSFCAGKCTIKAL